MSLDAQMAQILAEMSVRARGDNPRFEEVQSLLSAILADAIARREEKQAA